MCLNRRPITLCTTKEKCYSIRKTQQAVIAQRNKLDNRIIVWLKLLKFFLGLFMYMNVLPYMCVYYTCAWYLQRSEKGTRTPGSSIINVYKPLCGLWELNPGPL